MATSSEFVVEEVLDARLNTRGKFEYFIKWKGFQNDESTWEPEENVQGCDAVLAFSEMMKSGEVTLPSHNGFEKGLEADMIISATVSRGNIHYLVKWKNVDEATLLPSTEVCAKCPNLVIKFFEERMYYLSNCEHDRESSNLRME